MTLEQFKELKPLTKQFTICFLVQGDFVILAMKKRGFGEGYWNGYGGKPEAGETIEEALLRETYEESGVRLREVEQVAFIEFYYPQWRDTKRPETPPANYNHQCYVYLATKWNGQPQETEEMRPQAFPRTNLPLDKMWAADRLWWKFVLNGKKIKAQFLYNQDKKVEDQHIEFLDV